MDRFTDIAIGSMFTETSKAGFPRNGLKFLVWEKVSKSRATCVKQHNYGNQRMVGACNPYGPNSLVNTTWQSE